MSRDNTTGSYWSTLEETIAHGRHVITLSSDRITGSYCSILEKSRMEDWDKYTLRYRYQHSQSSEFKVVTPLQSVIESRNLKNTNKGKQKHKFKSKFKNFKKRKKYSKLQISESPLRLGIFKTYKKFSNFQILKLPLWFKVSGEYIEFSRLKKGDSFKKHPQISPNCF